MQHTVNISASIRMEPHTPVPSCSNTKMKMSDLLTCHSRCLSLRIFEGRTVVKSRLYYVLLRAFSNPDRSQKNFSSGRRRNDKGNVFLLVEILLPSNKRRRGHLSFRLEYHFGLTLGFGSSVLYESFRPQPSEIFLLHMPSSFRLHRPQLDKATISKLCNVESVYFLNQCSSV